jgi:hypothetical protein
MPENPLTPAIQQLLTTLPEMFPGVQKIPLANIRLNPNNPGAKAAEEDIAELAANIALVGLKNAAKVMPDPDGPLSPGVTLHPDNPRLKADGTPWSLSDFRFLNLSGELRQLACQRLQWTVMDGIILNPTPEQAVEITDLDNDVRQKGWWAKYQSVEALIKANPTLKQREIGTRLRIDKERVNWALRLLPLLNTEARGVLVRNPYKSSKGNKGISESAASHLADLGPGSAFKPGGTPNDPAQAAGSSLDPAQANLGPRLVASAQLLYPYPAIPPETQDLVYRTLAVACKHQMKEAQVQKLVEWVLAGNPPETFGSAPKTPLAKKAPGITPEALAKAVELAKALGVAEGRGEDTKPAQELLDAHLASVLRSQTEEHALSGPIPTKEGIGAEIKTAAASNTNQAVKLASPEGLNLLGQAWVEMKALFKPSPTDANGQHQEPLAQPSLAPRLVGSGQVTPTAAENFFLDWLAGIPVIQRIRKKIEKHEPLTKGEFLLLIADKAGWVLGWIVKILLKVVIEFFKLGLKLMKETYKAIAEVMPKKGKWGKFFKTAKLVLLIAFWGAVVWLILDVRQNGIWHPINLIRYKFHLFTSNKDSQPQSSPAVTSASSPQDEKQVLSVPISTIKEIGSHWVPEKKKENPAPTAAYQPAVSFAPSPASPAHTLYDPKILESEIASLPQDCVVKDYPLTPDEGMPGDLAVSRMQDMTDPDKYTMLIGNSKQIILSVNATTTNLVINHKSADPFGGFLDNNGPMNIFWEDVKYIHANEIDVETKTPSVIYLCSLVVSGAKYPLTIQCASAEDLEHLVSTMQYFIRSSRLGHDTALAGMPFLQQGLVLNNNRAVDKLWANSPMDKSGVQLGDYLWSVGKIAFVQQGKKDLEAALQSLPITLFVASDAEWQKALTAARMPGQSTGFRPKLRKVVLTSL